MPRARTLDPGASMAACLGALLRHLRTLRGLTQAGLGAAAGFDGSYVGAVERAVVRPSRDLVERCDQALGAARPPTAPARRRPGPRPTPPRPTPRPRRWSRPWSWPGGSRPATWGRRR